MPPPFPFGADRAEVRRWLEGLRESTRAAGDRRLTTPESLLKDQRRRLLVLAGFDPDADTDVSASPADSGNRRRLDLALDGGQINGHEAPIGLLGDFFTSLQGAVTAVAQALTGAPTAAAPVPGNIRAATVLRASAAFPSSYGLHLYGPERDGDAIVDETPGAPSSTLLDEAVLAIFDIAEDAQTAALDSDAGQLDERLVDRVVILGQRAVKHIGTLASRLADADVQLKLMWDPGAEDARTCVLDGHGAARLKRVTEGVHFSETGSETLRGRLVEASMRRGTVEIQTSSGDVVAARTATSVTSRLGDDLLGKKVIAEATVTVVRYAAGRERRAYTVTELRPAPA